MKKIAFCVVALAACVAFGERSLKPGVDAFNASVPADYGKNVAFSPFSFELDCCMFAEALDPIGRANVSEKLAVMTDFSGAYYPILDMFDEAAASNTFLFASARTIGVSDIPKVNADFKRRVFDMRTNASISLLWPTKGAERWFCAKLDGWMEEFVMPFGKIGSEEYSLVDAAVVVASLGEDAACQTSRQNFRAADGTTEEFPFVTFRAKADFLRNGDKTMLRIPLRGGAFLYLMMPGENKTLADLRKSIVGESMLSTVLEPLDPNVKGTGSAVCEVSLPKLDFIATTDMEKGFEALGIQQNEITYLYPALSKRTAFQCARFILREGDVADGAATLPAATDKTTFNRPFVFFVYCPEKNVIPVIGQFTGK